MFLPNSYQALVPGRIGPLVVSPSTDRELSRVYHATGCGPDRIMTTHGSPDNAPGPSAGSPGARTILWRIRGFDGAADVVDDRRRTGPARRGMGRVPAGHLVPLG